MPRYKSSVFEAIHETACDLHAGGCICNKKMRCYDALCLDLIPVYTGEDIRMLRQRLDLNQAVLAALLNVALSSVRQWESGKRKPCGASRKLLHLLDQKGPEVLQIAGFDSNLQVGAKVPE